MAKIKGVCKNIDGCDLAAEKLEQETDKSNFVCSECGKPLYHNDDAPGGDNPGGAGNMKKIIIGVVAVAAIGGGAYFGLVKDEPADVVAAAADTTAVAAATVPDGTEAAQVATTTPAPESEKTTSGTESDVSGTPKVNVGYGIFEGPVSGGKPNGIGVLYIKSNHSIDLKKANGEVLEVNPGDKIMEAKFTNGDLKQGELNRKDGTRKTFHIG